MELNGSINYNVCNIGSTYNTDNSETCKMGNVGRYKYYSYDTNEYTALPCYYSWGTRYLHPSVSSSGAVGSIYPAISTYGIVWWYKL